MALVLDAFADVDQEKVQPGGLHLVGNFFPDRVLTEQFVGFGRVGGYGIAPHVMTEVEHIAPDELSFFCGFRGGRNQVRKRAGSQDGGGSGFEESSAGKHNSLLWLEKKGHPANADRFNTYIKTYTRTLYEIEFTTSKELRQYLATDISRKSSSDIIGVLPAQTIF